MMTFLTASVLKDLQIRKKQATRQHMDLMKQLVGLAYSFSSLSRCGFLLSGSVDPWPVKAQMKEKGLPRKNLIIFCWYAYHEVSLIKLASSEGILAMPMTNSFVKVRVWHHFFLHCAFVKHYKNRNWHGGPTEGLILQLISTIQTTSEGMSCRNCSWSAAVYSDSVVAFSVGNILVQAFPSARRWRSKDWQGMELVFAPQRVLHVNLDRKNRNKISVRQISGRYWCNYINSNSNIRLHCEHEISWCKFHYLIFNIFVENLRRFRIQVTDNGISRLILCRGATRNYEGGDRMLVSTYRGGNFDQFEW